MSRLSPEEIEKRIRAWADVTMLSLELKLAALRKRHPELGESELRELMRKQLSSLKLLSGRPQDNLDAEKIFSTQRENLDMEYIQKWSGKFGIELKKEQF